jgi:hypothetical protein
MAGSELADKPDDDKNYRRDPQKLHSEQTQQEQHERDNQEKDHDDRVLPRRCL